MDIDMVVVHCVNGDEVRDLMKFLSEQMYFFDSLGITVRKDFSSHLFHDDYVDKGFRLSVDNKIYYGVLPISDYIAQRRWPIIPLNEFMSVMGNNDDLCKSDYSIDYLFL